MNVASLELCKELYELSGWSDCDFDWLIDKVDDKYTKPPETGYRTSRKSKIFDWLPAYDLGYLLRKLPTLPKYGAPYVGQTNNGEQYMASFMNWWALWEYDGKGSGKKWHNELIDKGFHELADTPENAACKLAIELFKRGVLKHG